MLFLWCINANQSANDGDGVSLDYIDVLIFPGQVECTAAVVDISAH